MEDVKEKPEKDDEPSFEKVLDKLGPLGKFQMIQVAFNYLCLFVMAFMVMSFVFEGYEPRHVCNAINETKLLSKYGLENDTTAEVVYESCQIKVLANRTGQTDEVDTMDCPNGRNFFDAKHTTFLSEWDLVCESSGVAELSQTCFNVGQMVGAFVGSSLADRFGRRPVMIGSVFFAMIAEWCIVFAPNIFVVYGLKLFSGMFYQALVSCYFVYAIELITPRHREANGVIMCFVWVGATMSVGAVAYIFRDDSWRYFQGAIGLSGLICLAYPFVLHESPRWLAATGKPEEALRVLEKASKMNGKDFKDVKETFVTYMNYAFPSKKQSLPINENDEQDSSDDVTFSGNEAQSQKKMNMLDLLRIKSLRKTTLITWYLFITNVMTYFGLYMTSSSVAGNRFLNFTLMTLVEIPSNICVYHMMKRMNRRFVLMFFFSLSAASLMASTLLDTFAGGLPGSSSASTALFIMGKFAITSAFNVSIIIVPEIFPTNLRSMSNGFCSGLARFGGMLAPFMRPLYHMIKWGPGTIFTVMCVIAFMLTILLPESKDADLPETVDDMVKTDKSEKLLKQ